jgi:hypothetical protein
VIAHWRRALLVLVVPVLAMLFWLASALTTGLPAVAVLPVDVQVGAASYQGGQGHKLAPVSLRVLQDVSRDTVASPSQATPAPTSRPTPTARPVAPPTPQPTPVPTSIIPIPTPSLPPTPTPTPSPAGNIAGQVVDSLTGVGLPNATVTLSPTGQAMATDATGGFRFTVAAGSYTVTASATGYRTAGQVVTVNAGQRAAVTIRLTSLTATGSLRGTVTDAASGNQITGATVTLSPGGPVAVTDLNGNFSMPAVPNGSYTMIVTALGYVSHAEAVTILPSQTTTVQVRLSR